MIKDNYVVEYCFFVVNNFWKFNVLIRKGSINVVVKCFVVWLYYKYKLK